MNTIVVTGASGYLGGLTARAFARSHGPEHVRCLVRSHEQAEPLIRQGFQVVVGDLTDLTLPERLTDDCAVLVHAAAHMTPGTRCEVFAVNVQATDRLAHAALASNVGRLIFISSIEAYGDFGNRELTEDEPYQPVTHIYAQSKMLAEKSIIRRYRQAHSTAYTILRPGAVYGPHSKYWTHRYLNMARTGSIRVLGDGGRIYPVYEDDLIAAITTAATCPAAAGQAFNIVHDENLTWWDWARAHHDLAGTGQPRKRPMIALKLPSWLGSLTGTPDQRTLRSELRKASIPNDKACSILNWSPRKFHSGMTFCQNESPYPDC